MECCEQFHVHYRNIRLILSRNDFLSMARGMADALERWKKQGEPPCSKTTHIELCRKKVATEKIEEDSVRINHNQNLYKRMKGRVFEAGSDFTDEDTYIHLKIRDVRHEMSLEDFRALAQAVKEADEKLQEVY